MKTASYSVLANHTPSLSQTPMCRIPYEQEIPEEAVGGEIHRHSVSKEEADAIIRTIEARKHHPPDHHKA